MNKKRLIIGLHGPKGCGKDYAANVLANSQYKFKRVAFADPIKNKICETFGIKIEDLDRLKRASSIAITENIHEANKTYSTLSGRDFVRNFGMMMREYDEEQFNRYVEDFINYHPDENIVITDVRFQNEVNLIYKLGGTVIELYRDGYTYDGHITENSELQIPYPRAKLHNQGKWFAEVILREIEEMSRDEEQRARKTMMRYTPPLLKTIDEMWDNKELYIRVPKHTAKIVLDLSQFKTEIKQEK